ncbi:M48 family metallopeptidase [Xanthomonas floridensis]|uniref:M48 family metallopeptidase n=1 Tax=Xanthomonas floridensis TaxID=1843580 RepID=A0A1A9MB22_9XANT|nr:M48 family metallopeptidase [Xanthomonas floridensis]MEA5125409.1 M48 family metallopeptidase [Xanthomonas floridensis]MEA5133185.1 M48 family metallopeptidase [Xanthomonas floridensis]OAG67271.1 Zn-dependent protease with chaperone function [Xanthomonas floridensis]
MLGLGGFIAVYLGLLGWFGWTAYRLVSGLVQGSGGEQAVWLWLVAIGAAFLAVFMTKALIFNKRAERDTRALELSPAEQPELFAFLHRLADEAGAPRPHKVYLSAQVNAGVFYDLSLLNLLLPSRKNLDIGLGLVNVLNLGELKAVLAHEFGHFAQRTMAVGRWVYIAQQIAAHIVGKRDALDKLLATLSRIDLRVAWIGWGLSLIVWSIRSLVEIAFRGVVLAQRALSREMEYQADLVAASLTGSDALVHALHKLEAADDGWQRALRFAGREFAQERPVKDLFAIQSRIIEHMRVVLNDPAHGATPTVPAQAAQAHRLFQNDIAQASQMWATHPPSAAREENLKRRYIACPIDARPAMELLRNAQALREQVSRRLLTGEVSGFVDTAVSLAALEREFAALPLSRRYQGLYLGRSCTRNARTLAELYADPLPDGDLLQALDGLYLPADGQAIEQLRERERQRATLQGLMDGGLRATGGVLTWKGTNLSRAQLPAVIAELDGELQVLRARVSGHDRRCRSVHLAAANRLGGDWPALLRGYLAVLHYTDHTIADLDDAYLLQLQTFHAVIADGRVSAKELRQLVAACNQVQRALRHVYEQAPRLRLNAPLSAALGQECWEQCLPEFRLAEADEHNIDSWMKVAKGWVQVTMEALEALRDASLEQLLQAEDAVAQRLRSGEHTPTTDTPAVAPGDYPVRLPGDVRQRNLKQNLWQRFLAADGLFPSVARVAVAASIVAGVLWAGGSVGLAEVVAYNGLQQTVTVSIDDQTASLPANGRHVFQLPEQASHHISTRTLDGAVIERFDAPSGGHGGQFAYNVAGAALLVNWRASYGSAAEDRTRRLANARWERTTADAVFEEPPAQVSDKGSQYREVLTAVAERPPYQLLGELTPAQDLALMQAHARWDDAQSVYLEQWMQQLHSAAPQALPAIVAERLQRNPQDVVALRAQQDVAAPEQRAQVCAQQTALAAAHPAVSGLQYAAIRCTPNTAARDQAFLSAQQRWPKDPWLQRAAATVHAEQHNLPEAQALYEQAAQSPAMADEVVSMLARLQRYRGQAPDLSALAQRSPSLASALALETGKGTEGTPYQSYHALAGGQLDAAVTEAAPNPDVQARIVRLAAASQGASAALLQQARALDAKAGLDMFTAPTAWALAARQGWPVEPLRDATVRATGEDAAGIMRFFTAVQAGADQQRADAALTGVSLVGRGLAYAMAAVWLGERCPQAWREGAKQLLFSSERPYLG